MTNTLPARQRTAEIEKRAHLHHSDGDGFPLIADPHVCHAYQAFTNLFYYFWNVVLHRGFRGWSGFERAAVASTDSHGFFHKE